MLFFIPPAFPLYPSVAMKMVSITPLLIQFIVVQIPFSHGIISENLGRLCVMVAGQKSLLHLGHPIYHLFARPGCNPSQLVTATQVGGQVGLRQLV